VRVTNANALLAIYYSSRNGWSIPSVMGRDPNVQRHPNTDLPKIQQTCINVGWCLESLTADEQAAIAYKWSLLTSRDEYNSKEEMCRIRAMEALREGGKATHKRLMTESHGYAYSAKRITKEVRDHEKRPDYIRAMDRFEIEVKTRDLYARALCGPDAGVGLQ